MKNIITSHCDDRSISPIIRKLQRKIDWEDLLDYCGINKYVLNFNEKDFLVLIKVDDTADNEQLSLFSELAKNNSPLGINHIIYKDL
jgi:hypothetical protein